MNISCMPDRDIKQDPLDQTGFEVTIPQKEAAVVNGNDGSLSRQYNGYIGGVSGHMPQIGLMPTSVLPEETQVPERNAHLREFDGIGAAGRRPGIKYPGKYRFNAEKAGVFPPKDEGHLHVAIFTSCILARSVRLDFPNQRGRIRFKIQMKKAVLMKEFRICRVSVSAE